MKKNQVSANGYRGVRCQLLSIIKSEHKIITARNKGDCSD